jgi:hypothetical protein
MYLRIGGYIVENLGDSIRLTFISQTDALGMIPDFIKNQIGKGQTDVPYNFV